MSMLQPPVVTAQLLQLAAATGNFRITHMLLKAGADITAPAWERGLAALEFAAGMGRIDMV